MSKKDIIIIGTGGMAREVRWVIENSYRSENHWNVIGWVSKEKTGTIISGLPVLGDDDWLLEYNKPIDVVVSVGNGELRRRIVNYIKENKNISFPPVIADSAEVSKYVKLGKGTIIMNKSILTVDIRIGDFFLCNYGCSVGHDCHFSNYVTLCPGVNISGNVNLGECVTVGTGAAVIQGISIGDNATIGAGAVVIRDISLGCTAVGVPARPLKR